MTNLKVTFEDTYESVTLGTRSIGTVFAVAEEANRCLPEARAYIKTDVTEEFSGFILCIALNDGNKRYISPDTLVCVGDNAVLKMNLIKKYTNE